MSEGRRSLVRAHVIAAGVKNLREYGYPACTPDNILTDRIYRSFFAGMLADNKGKGGSLVDSVLEQLEAEIAAAGGR